MSITIKYLASGSSPDTLILITGNILLRESERERERREREGGREGGRERERGEKEFINEDL